MMKRCVHLRRPGQLKDKFRAVAALLRMGLGDREIAKLTAQQKQSVEKQRRILSSNPHPVVRRMMEEGIPRTCSVPILGKVRCKCGALLEKVPCCSCTPPDVLDEGIRKYNYTRRPSDIDLIHPSVPLEATSAPPGSEEKLEVMRKRVERGESVFHDDDPKSY